MSNALINTIITRKTRQEFARLMQFENGGLLEMNPGSTANLPLLYIHIPFCEKLCPYCSFHRVVFDDTLCRDYFAALRGEIMLYKDKGYDFSGIYVGGGTPTILMEELEKTLALARECFSIRQISVETNPNHLTDRNIEALKGASVNRLSVGVQSFDDSLLRNMDRYEKYGSGEVIARQLSQTLGYFDTLNADMMFNFPSQTTTMLERDLDILREIGIDQITYYPLMVSDLTRKTVSEKIGIVDYNKEERFYHRIVERLVPTYRHSSAWCFSKEAVMIDEYIVDYDEYAGLGSGAIGYLNGICYANTFNIEEYIIRVKRGKMPITAFRSFLPKDQLRYDFLIKLFGMKMDIPSLQKKYERIFYRALWFNIVAFILAGALKYRSPYFLLTRRGCYHWVIMMREFFIAVNNFRDFCRSR
ncbi:MAG TPA: coproporphyrinogen III oxidase family protein [Syntrophales bacterium]|nr:coproporphyrinogen III oxidase family protein [Syntrophales bacterium]